MNEDDRMNHDTYGGVDPEVAERLLSRRRVITAAGSLALAAGPLALLARRASAQQAASVTEVLNFALRLEYLEDEFYRRGLAADGLIPEGDRDVFGQIGEHESAHVALLRGALGADAIRKPAFDFTAGGMFPDVFTNYQTFLALSQGFEDTGVRAYKGQAANLMSDDDLLTTALQIHSVEARHAAQVRRMRGREGWIPFDDTNVPALEAVYAGEANTSHPGATLPFSEEVTEAFDEPLTMDAVLAIAGPFIRPPSSQDLGMGDFAVLNFAYALEQLEADFYIQVAGNFYGGATDEERSILVDIRDHEIAHRDFLRTALGDNAIGDLTFDFSAVDFDDRDSVLTTARTFEDLGVSAYNGAGELLENTDFLLVAGKIVSVEARHAAAIRDLMQPRTRFFAGDDIVEPDTGLGAYNPPSAVLAAANGFIVNDIDASGLPVPEED